jgi:DNA-binding response OmpR family regulator
MEGGPARGLPPLSSDEAMEFPMTADLSNGTDAAIVHCGDIEIDRERYLVTVANRRLDLTFMEFNILVAITE